jgi:2-polyprenyl-3-methyl-5-hydroxy-6-metoxy-1,4-benzoquinol methylase
MERPASLSLSSRPEGDLAPPSQTSFDRRIVRYEELHAISQVDFRTFVDTAAIYGHCRLLDCGSGYGAFTREVLLATESSRLSGETHLKIDLIDESPVQIERAQTELQAWLDAPGVSLRFVQGTFPDDLNEFSEQYDVVACKMVLHEIRKERQLSFLENTHECLSRAGRLVLWDVCLSPDIAPFYRAVIRSKDALAGYPSMVERRYFLTEEEMRALFHASTYRHVTFVKDILYRFDTRKRFIPEFGGDSSRFAQWQEFVRESVQALSPEVLAKLRYVDDGNSISFDVRKVIVTGKRLD